MNNSEPLKRLAEKVDEITPQETRLWLTEQLAYLWGQFPFVGVMLALMVLDVVTGYLAAIVKKDVDSNVSFRGVIRKGQMILMVGAGMVFEILYPDIPFGKIIAMFICLGEMTSIIENCDRAGVPIPQALRETLRRLKAAEKANAEGKIENKVIIDVHATKVTDEHGNPIPPTPERKDEHGK